MDTRELANRVFFFRRKRFEFLAEFGFSSICLVVFVSCIVTN